MTRRDRRLALARARELRQVAGISTFTRQFAATRGREAVRRRRRCVAEGVRRRKPCVVAVAVRRRGGGWARAQLLRLELLEDLFAGGANGELLGVAPGG